jgi:hypothetical protein
VFHRGFFLVRVYSKRGRENATTTIMFESIAWHRDLNTDEEPDANTFDSVWELLRIPLVTSVVSLAGSMVLFAIAVHFEWNANLTPRAANRPKKVLKNALLHGMPEKYKDKIYAYPFAWIQWAYNLTYKQCLLGIPGTGTRKDGWEGPLLKTNLDAVVMLKFHTLLFKISVLVAALCILLVPINYTASCNPDVFGVGTCALQQNMSYGFYKTTFANLPNKIVSSKTKDKRWVIPICGALRCNSPPFVLKHSIFPFLSPSFEMQLPKRNKKSTTTISTLRLVISQLTLDLSLLA